LSPFPTKVLSDKQNTAVINTLTDGTFIVAQNSKTFGDIKKHWAKTSIESLASKMVLGGITQNLYVPERKVTRAEFVTMIVKSLGINYGPVNTTFKDVKTGSWYCGAIMAGVDSDIISGYGNGKFMPLAGLTREQAAIISIRALEIAGVKVDLTDSEASSLLVKFRDNKKISTWGKTYIAKAIKIELISGYRNQFFQPAKYITRAEAATLIQKILVSAGLINAVKTF
jgi:hypothetical protein